MRQQQEHHHPLAVCGIPVTTLMAGNVMKTVGKNETKQTLPD